MNFQTQILGLFENKSLFFKANFINQIFRKNENDYKPINWVTKTPSYWQGFYIVFENEYLMVKEVEIIDFTSPVFNIHVHWSSELGGQLNVGPFLDVVTC